MVLSVMDEMSKQGLYIWLKSVVENRRCPGVTWIDEANGVFQIPWSNQKSRTWQKEDSSVFLEYAKHTCKYKPGDKMDFPKWKQNLKSAINKNRYIERLREHDRLSGSKPYRVYKFLVEKADRKGSNDDFPEIVKNVAVDYLNPVDRSNSDIFGLVAENNEVLLAQGDSSTGHIGVFSDSGSRSSRSSPLSTTSGPVTFPLSPDIPRGDSCDHLQGNIPTFVSYYCETPIDTLSGEESVSCHMLESVLTDASQPTQSTAELPKCVEMNQPSDGSEKGHTQILDSHPETQGNDSQMYSFPAITAEATQKQLEPEILSYSVIANFNEKKRHKIGYAKLRQDSNQATGITDFHKPSYLLNFQRNVLSSSTDAFLNVSKAVSLDSGLALSFGSVQKDSSQDYPNEQCLTVQPAIQGFHCEVNSSTDVPMIQEVPMIEDMPTSSLPELGMVGAYSSDLPVSMDTYDVNLLSDNQKFSGSQFLTYRNAQMPEAAPQHISISPQVKDLTDDSVMHVQVLYGTPHRTVTKITVTSKRSSCRLFYGSVNCSFMQRAIQGQQDAEEVELPSVDSSDCEYHDENKKTAIRKILNDMELGIVISYSNNDIYVERRCLPRVYLSDGVSKSESLPRSTKKRPDVKTLAFDYNKHFKESIEQHKINNNNAVPKDHFLLTIGYQILANDDSPTRMVPVYVVVRHVKAAKERFNILGASTIAPNPMCSDPNSFDKNIQLFKELDLKTDVKGPQLSGQEIDLKTIGKCSQIAAPLL